MLSEYVFKLIFIVLFVFAVMAIGTEIRSVGKEIKLAGKECSAYTFSVPMEDVNDDFDLLDEMEPYKEN